MTVGISCYIHTLIDRFEVFSSAEKRVGRCVFFACLIAFLHSSATPRLRRRISDPDHFITFGAVLEHIYDPSLALEKAMYWAKPGAIIHAEVPSSNYLMSRLVNLFFRLRGTNFATHISPVHQPFHMHEFTLESFRQNGRKLGYEIAESRIDVCSIYHVPRVFHWPLRWWMEQHQTGMQLTVFLRKPAPNAELSESDKKASIKLDKVIAPLCSVHYHPITTRGWYKCVV